MDPSQAAQIVRQRNTRSTGRDSAPNTLSQHYLTTSAQPAPNYSIDNVAAQSGAPTISSAYNAYERAMSEAAKEAGGRLVDQWSQWGAPPWLAAIPGTIDYVGRELAIPGPGEFAAAGNLLSDGGAAMGALLWRGADGVVDDALIAVPDGTKRLYNASLVDYDPDGYLEPVVSDWVREVAAGEGIDDIDSITSELAYLSDKPDEWVKMIVGRKLGKNPAEVTTDDIRTHGRLNIVDAEVDYDPVYQVGDYLNDGSVTNLSGERIKLWDSALYDEGDVYTGQGRFVDLPAGPEPNDYITREALKLTSSLTGDDLVKFLDDLPLPTDQASRMARAREQGWSDQTWYHSTKHDFRKDSEFKEGAGKSRRGSDFGFHFGTPEAADEAIMPKFVRDYRDGLINDPNASARTVAESKKEIESYYENANVLPVKLRLKKTLRLPDFGRWDAPGNASSNLKLDAYYHGKPRLKPDLDTNDVDVAQELLELADSTYDKAEWTAGFKRILEKHGYDSVSYKNMTEGGESMMVIDPKNIRSINAKFDPKNKDSSNLLAGIGAGAIGATYLLGNESQPGL